MPSNESTAAIELARTDRRYLPGEIVEGTARWLLPSSARRIVVRLAFRITPTGESRSSPRAIVELAYMDPPACGGCDFRFKLPPEPYSFDGKLLSIAWAVDVRVALRRGDQQLAAVSLTMSPSGEPIRPA